MSINISVPFNGVNFTCQAINGVVFGVPDNIHSDIQAAFDNGDYIVLPQPQSVTNPPNPKGFYEKMIGMDGDTYPLHLVYKSITFRALDDSQDTSSLAYAVLVYNNALNINDWSLPQTKEAYLAAYEILKRFLSVGQISIIDEENINFGLV